MKERYHVFHEDVRMPAKIESFNKIRNWLRKKSDNNGEGCEKQTYKTKINKILEEEANFDYY